MSMHRTSALLIALAGLLATDTVHADLARPGGEVPIDRHRDAVATLESSLRSEYRTEFTSLGAVADQLLVRLGGACRLLPDPTNALRVRLQCLGDRLFELGEERPAA